MGINRHRMVSNAGRKWRANHRVQLSLEYTELRNNMNKQNEWYPVHTNNTTPIVAYRPAIWCTDNGSSNVLPRPPPERLTMPISSEVEFPHLYILKQSRWSMPQPRVIDRQGRWVNNVVHIQISLNHISHCVALWIREIFHLEFFIVKWQTGDFHVQRIEYIHFKVSIFCFYFKRKTLGKWNALN